MRAGLLRELVTVQQRTATTDVGPGKTVSWSTLASVRAQIVPVNAEERIQAMAVGSHVAYRVLLRFRTDITAKMRLLWGSRTLQVEGVLENRREGKLELLCSEVA